MNDSLMKGLTLIDVYDVKEWNWSIYLIAGAFLLVGIIFIFLEGILDSCFFDSLGCFVIVGSLLVSVINFGVSMYHNYFCPNREFKVTCDENVSFFDIEAEYDVIDFDGEIYTIREEVD